MVEFGYKITSGNRVDLDNTDNNLFRRLKDLSPGILSCIACGCCASTCSAGNFSDVSFRSSILLMERGLNKQSINIINGCMLCGKCTIICPRGINIRETILSISDLYKTIEH
jgi:heterodisulfide reductase subunit C